MINIIEICMCALIVLMQCVIVTGGGFVLWTKIARSNFKDAWRERAWVAWLISGLCLYGVASALLISAVLAEHVTGG